MRETQSTGPRGLDLNLLEALDALLTERSVTGAADRLHLSEPAVSRALGRIRRALGDPILVRAGRNMVPTPHALAIEAEVRDVVERARALFSSTNVDIRSVARTMTMLAPDLVIAAYGPALLACAAADAPGVRLRFLPESHVDLPMLREGEADLEVGLIDSRAPEIHREPLYKDRMVGLVRPGHPLLRPRHITVRRYAQARHLVVSRRGRGYGPIDAALEQQGLRRNVAAITGTSPAALFLLLGSDLVGQIPARVSHVAERVGLVVFDLPVDLPSLSFAMAWHPRHDADPAHAWLRERVRELMAA
ncbi:LysR family transcriptional regulator [Nocardia sp. R16R-3T]